MALDIVKFIKGLRVTNDTDRSKQMELSVSSSATTSTKTTIEASQTANRTVSLPNATDTLVGRATSDTLTNKSINADNNTVTNLTDSTIKASAAISRSKLATGTASRVLVNDGSGVLSDSSVTTTELNALSGVSGNVVSENATQTLSNKTLDNTNIITVKDNNLTIQDNADATKQAKFEASGITTATTRTLTIPDANTTIMGTDATQTVSNKTMDNTNSVTIKDANLIVQDDVDNTKQVQFEASSITTGTTRTLTVPDANTTIVGTDASQTLTNKTINGSSNTVTNISLTTSVTGTLPIANGGTGQTSQTNAFDALSPTTTKGDVIAHNGSDNVRVAIGSDGTFLKADSAAAAGVSWASAAGVLVVSTKTTTYTATASDDVILADASGASFTITLPAASGNTGKVLRFKKIDSDWTKVVTIDGNASETIDGATTTTLNTTNEELSIICDGTNWQILERRTATDWVTTTSTITAATTNPTKNGTPSKDIFAYRRDGPNLIIRFEYDQSAGGTSGSGEYYLNIPSTLGTIDTNITNTNTSATTTIAPNAAAVGYFGAVGSQTMEGRVTVYDNSKMRFAGIYNFSSWQIWSSGFLGFGATLKVSANIIVPMSGWKA
jgi:hypothetical protein